MDRINKKHSINCIILILLIILSLFNFPLNSVETFTQTSLKNPGIFINEVSSWIPDNLDPATNNVPQDRGIIHLVYERLLQYTGSSLNQFTDSLAYTNYTIDSTGTVYTFWIRPGITFALQPNETVGQPVNAYVLQYSIQRAIIRNDPQGPAPYTIDSFIAGANAVSQNSELNVSTAKKFLDLQSVKAVYKYELQITINEPFIGFIQALQSTVTSAISPKAIIDNEPTKYNTNISDTEFGMVPLNYFFPGMDNNSILSNLELPNSYSIENSGVVPNSPANVGSPNEYTWLTDHSAGTGSWIIQSNTVYTGANIVRNPNWWNKDTYPTQNGIKEVIWKTVSDTNSRIADLENGTADSVDIPYSNLFQIINTTTLVPLIPDIQITEYNTLKTNLIGFNMNPTISSSVINESSNSNYAENGMNYTRLLQYSWNNATGGRQYASRNNPFTSLLFREAFAYAFNYESFFKNIYASLVLRMQGVIPQGLVGSQTQLIAQGFIPTFNPVTAKNLFNKVGWKGTITILYNSYSNLVNEESFQLLRQSIENLNVGINIDLLGSTEPSYPSINQTTFFQSSWNPDYADANDFTTTYYGNKSQNGIFSVIENYHNPYVNSLVTQGAKTSSLADRISIYRQMEENATQDFPYIYLGQPKQVLVVRNWIKEIASPSANLNYMNYYPSYQFLTKYYMPDIVPPSNSTIITSSYTISPSTSTSKFESTNNSFSITILGLKINSFFKLIGGLSLVMISFLIAIGLVYEYKKIKYDKKNPTRRIFSIRNRLKKAHGSRQTLSEDTLNKIEEIIKENDI